MGCASFLPFHPALATRGPNLAPCLRVACGKSPACADSLKIAPRASTISLVTRGLVRLQLRPYSLLPFSPFATGVYLCLSQVSSAGLSSLLCGGFLRLGRPHFRQPPNYTCVSFFLFFFFCLRHSFESSRRILRLDERTKLCGSRSRERRPNEWLGTPRETMASAILFVFDNELSSEPGTQVLYLHTHRGVPCHRAT